MLEKPLRRTAWFVKIVQLIVFLETKIDSENWFSSRELQ